MRQIIFSTLLALLFVSGQSGASEIPQSMKDRVPKIVELKDKGVIGEEPNGLLGLVIADKEAQKIVDEENADRLKLYKARASRSAHDLETLQKVLGEARIEQEKSGRFIKDLTGSWKKKP